MVGDEKRVFYICNAKDYDAPILRSEKVSEHRQQFEALGFEFVEYDLREYFINKLPRDCLDGFGLVWCAGGNTFLLRAAIRYSGLENVLKATVRSDKIVYGGSSAGAIVATPSLKGTEFFDHPEQVREIYKLPVVWDGLRFADISLVPHYNGDWGEAEHTIEYLESKKLPYKALRDGQVYIVYGKKRKIVA